MKQRDCNFDSMSTSELWDFYTELGSMLAAKLEAEATLLQRRLDEIHGGVWAASTHISGKRKQAAAVKYRNPQPPFQTWSGRGTQPRWVKDALEHGMTLDSLRIEPPISPQDEETQPA